MYDESKVSLWLGHFPNKLSLQEYVREIFTEDEDEDLGENFSVFARNFLLGYFDYQAMESIYLENDSNNIRELLQHVSYSEQLISCFQGAVIEKSIIL